MRKEVEAIDPIHSGGAADSYYNPRETYFPKKIKKDSLPEDSLQIGDNSVLTGVYTDAAQRKTVTADIQSIKQKAEKAAENLRALVEKLAAQQKLYIELAAKRPGSFSENEKDDDRQDKRDFAYDKTYGVDAVSGRVVNFAKSIFGYDKAKLDDIKSAINQGFSDAEKTFGSKLPDVCGQTHEEIMKKLDEWSTEA